MISKFVMLPAKIGDFVRVVKFWNSEELGMVKSCNSEEFGIVNEIL